MLPDRVSNPGPLTYESGALPIALRGPCFVQALGHMRAPFDRNSLFYYTCNKKFKLTFLEKKIFNSFIT